jgi:diaminopimelate decarboxylase
MLMNTDTTELDERPVAGDASGLEWIEGLDTPCYVFDPQSVIAHYKALRAALGTRLVVSLKANSHADLFVRCGQAFEDGIELASQGELDIVVGRGKHVRYLNNPAMSDALMQAGIASRCRFILDSPEMVGRFIALATGKETEGVMLRINAGVLLGARAPKALGDHFGMTPAEAHTAARQLTLAGRRVTGLHTFAGSGNFRVGEADAAQADSADLAWALAKLAEDLEAVTGTPLIELNLGGGFAEKGHDSAEFERYRARIAPLAQRYTLIHEAGRAIFGNCGQFVTRVRAVKAWDDRVIAVCDGGMSHSFLLAKTEAVLKTWQAPQLLPRDSTHEANALPIVFVGNTCNRADVIGRLERHPQLPQPGDYVIFAQCGAYHHSYTVSGFLSHKPAHVYIRQA